MLSIFKSKYKEHEVIEDESGDFMGMIGSLLPAGMMKSIFNMAPGILTKLLLTLCSAMKDKAIADGKKPEDYATLITHSAEGKEVFLLVEMEGVAVKQILYKLEINEIQELAKSFLQQNIKP